MSSPLKQRAYLATEFKSRPFGLGGSGYMLAFGSAGGLCKAERVAVATIIVAPA